MNSTRVLLADDNQAIVDTAVRALQSEFEVVGSVADGQSLLRAAAMLKPDVLILDISMPILNGIEVAHLLKESGSNAKIVFLTVHEDPDFIRESLAAGALGYVSKLHLATDLLVAIREALAGRTFISPTLLPDSTN